MTHNQILTTGEDAMLASAYRAMSESQAVMHEAIYHFCDGADIRSKIAGALEVQTEWLRRFEDNYDILSIAVRKAQECDVDHKDLCCFDLTD